MEQLVQILLARGEVIFYITVFASVVLFTVAIANMTVVWAGVRRRTLAAGGTKLPDNSLDAVRLFDDNSRTSALANLLPIDETQKSEIKMFLNGAGYYGTRIVTVYQSTRVATAIIFGLLTASTYGRLYPTHPFFVLVAASLVMTLLGYMVPRILVSFRRDRLFEEHRQGFPDFLDLLVICVEAGIGIDGAIDRVGRELVRSFPSLSRNLGFMSLELRAGRSTRDALENLGGRLGIEEAKSFTTLIQQSEELGTSLIQSLRVFSDEMRDKRLARAEEKAQSLPVKLVLPLAFFIFPVILGITLMPVALKLFAALYPR